MADDKQGMLRHVDVLGRIVIPRGVRKALHINYGDLMEFCVTSNQQVIMRKYHIIREIIPLVRPMVKAARINNDCDIVIIDTEKVICKNGEVDSNYGEINDKLRPMIEDRNQQLMTNLVISESLTLTGECVFHPIVCDGDVLGAVIVRANDIQDAQQISSLVAEFLINYFGA